jgi:Mg/Co/Ni transporter MgtE
LWALAVGVSALAAVLAGGVVGLLVPLAEAAVHLDPAVALRPIVISLMCVVTPTLYALVFNWVLGGR